MRTIRLLILGAVLVAAGLWSFWGSVGSTTSAERPNIIFVLTDDMDASLLTFMSKLKSLVADQGLTLTNFFSTFSLCCPARATILRGQYGHNTQILGNMPPSGGYDKFHNLGEENSSVATWLQAAGYKTMYVGKYLNGYPGSAGRTFVPPGWNEWYSAVGGNPYNEYDYVLNENGKLVPYGRKPEDYGTDVYARKTVDFIQRTAKEGKPFFVHFSAYAPHSPYTPAPRHQTMFQDATVPQPPNFNETDVSDKPDYIRLRPSLTAQTIRQLDHNYVLRLRSLQAVDDAIGAMVDALKAAGQLENTYIFFTSDNGYHLGNHRLVEGKIAPYEEDIKLPFVVRGPGIPAGRTLPHLAGNVDLAPTWAELAGAKAPEFVDGRSLVPLLGSTPPATDAWRQSFLLENGEMGRRAATMNAQTYASSVGIDERLLEPEDRDFQLDQQGLGVPAFRGIRTKDYLYIEYTTGERELYDLNKDPYELQNLSAVADPALLRQLSARVAELKTCAGEPCRTIESGTIATR
jgi:arylsulfatase A-like enzyme